MKTLKSIFHTLGIIWSTAMTILAFEGWVLAGCMAYRSSGDEEKKRETKVFSKTPDENN